jgi:hypothetical protein
MSIGMGVAPFQPQKDTKPGSGGRKTKKNRPFSYEKRAASCPIELNISSPKLVGFKGMKGAISAALCIQLHFAPPIFLLVPKCRNVVEITPSQNR